MSFRSQLLNSTEEKTPIYLNVYKFWPTFNTICPCCSVYHTGIQVYGDQYMYNGFEAEQTGVFQIQPKSADYEFSEQILLGYTQLSSYEFDAKILQSLRNQFLGHQYDLLQKNCNHFCYSLVKKLKIQDKFPKNVLRATNFCNLFRCCIPKCILNGRLDWFLSQKDNKSDHYRQLNQDISVQQGVIVKKVKENKQTKGNSNQQS